MCDGNLDWVRCWRGLGEPLIIDKEDVEAKMSWFSYDDEGPIQIESNKVDGSEGEPFNSKEDKVEDKISWCSVDEKKSLWILPLDEYEVESF